MLSFIAKHFHCTDQICHLEQFIINWPNLSHLNIYKQCVNDRCYYSFICCLLHVIRITEYYRSGSDHSQAQSAQRIKHERPEERANRDAPDRRVPFMKRSIPEGCHQPHGQRYARMKPASRNRCAEADRSDEKATGFAPP